MYSNSIEVLELEYVSKNSNEFEEITEARVKLYVEWYKYIVFASLKSKYKSV